MTDQNIERIAQMLARLEARMDARFEQIDARFAQIDARLANLETFKREVIKEFKHSLDIKHEELFHRIGLLRDGVADHVERGERLEELVTGDEAKLLDLLMHDHDPRAQYPSQRV